MGEKLDIAAVKKIAKLARLEIDDARAEAMAGELSAVLGYIERLGELDLEGVEPLVQVEPERDESGLAQGMGEELRADEPGEVFTNDTVVDLAPEALGPFVKVPKVLGEGGGA